MSLSSREGSPVEPCFSRADLIFCAAAAIMAIAPSALAQRNKADQSPVTLADEASQDAIFEGLRRLLPGVPVVSEEAAAEVLPGNLSHHSRVNCT